MTSRGETAACTGYLALVLHAHLPFVRHPEHDGVLEERWLFEAITESYVPLILAFERLLERGRPFRLTLSLSPTLICMLDDELLRERYLRHVDDQIRLAQREIGRTRDDPDLGPLARMYLEKAEFYDRIAKRPRSAIIAYSDFVRQFPLSKERKWVDERIAVLQQILDEEEKIFVDNSGKVIKPVSPIIVFLSIAVPILYFGIPIIVLIYFYIKYGRVEGLTQGSYYYHPIHHCLYPLVLNVQLDHTIYGRLYNRAIFDEAAFAIFLIVDLDAIFPMYGPNSVHLATLDSGYMSQLLTTTAIEHRLGLCPIGSLNFTPIRHLFSLKEGQILLHSLLGGAIGLEENSEKHISPAGRFEDIEEGKI